MNHPQPGVPPPPPFGAMGRGVPGPHPHPQGGGRPGPHPNFQGPPPGHQAHPGHSGHPGHPAQGGPPPGGRGQPLPQMQMPMRPRYESSHVVDLNASEKRPLDDAAYRKLLTTHTVFSIRKVVPTGKEKSTWAKAVVTEEALSQEDIVAQLKKLKSSPQTITDKKGALFPNQQGQVNKLLDRLKTEESDQHFDWSLVQLDRRERSSNKVRETVLITVIVKRSPRDEVDATALFTIIDRQKQEKLAHLTRPPMQHQHQSQTQPQSQPQPQPQPQGQGQNQCQPQFRPQNAPPNPNSQPQAPIGIPHTSGQKGGDRGRSRSRSRQRPTRYQSDSNSESESDSDTFSTGASTISSSLVTSISSHSDGRSKKYSSRSRRGRSQSKRRPREHHKKYYAHRSESPEPIFQEFRRGSHPESPYVGEAVPLSAPNAIVQAFQQGREEERAAAQYYLSQSHQPIIIDEPSRAVVPAGRRELEYDTIAPRYPARQHAELPMIEAPRYREHQYSRPAPRYRDDQYNERHLDDLYEDDSPPLTIRKVRSVPREANYRRRFSDAESYIDRDSTTTRIPFTGLRPQIPQFRHHPFIPRSPPRHRYGSSYSSDSAYAS
ncbi:uncharacterized protein EAF01_003186 [Botrytis porri]|uniref:uncharacterized protein n=1 Tax=Botrytis porri TaxID=87229 RepID=UPI0018FF3ED7|nr:uncharacterized protein EAF01_003186 [Botrytis porri]KAF7909468.1 hypothetical protein EAF01_003186 [Botrytis porri]